MKPKLQYQGTSEPLVTNARRKVTLDNARRNLRLHVRLQGPVVVAGGTAGAAKNGGSLLATCLLALTENGNDTMRLLPAWLYAMLASYDAAQPLNFARLPDNATAGTYELFEEFSFPFANRWQARGQETAYFESNDGQPFELTAIRLPNASLNLAAVGAATVTLGDLTVSVTQDYTYVEPDTSLPLFRPGIEVLEQNIAGASSQLPVDFKIDERVSDVVTVAMAEDADGATIFVPAGGVINALAFRGSNRGEEIIGPTPVPYASLVSYQREFAGGDVGFLDAGYVHSFIRDGMLSGSIRAGDFKNLRMYLDCQPLAGATNSRVLFAVRTLTRPKPASNGRQSVAPEAALPAWAR